MSAPVRVSERDLRVLAGIVSQDRPDVPAKEGLPPSLLADLMSQIRCDAIGYGGFDSGRQETWPGQVMTDSGAVIADAAPVQWQTRGSHRQYKHPAKPGRVTVAGKLSAVLPPGTERSILRQAGLNRRTP